MAGSIIDLGNGRYRLFVSAGVGLNKKRQRYSKTIEASSERAAEKELAKFIAEIEKGSYIKPSSLTFGDFAIDWMKKHAEKDLAPKTVVRYREMLENRVIPAIGHIALEKLKPMHFIGLYENMQEDGIRKDGKSGGLSTQTIKHHHRLIHTILETAVKWQLIQSNPAKNVEPPKVQKKKIVVYDESDIAKLFELLAKQKPKYILAVYLGITTGMRLGELMGLEWAHIDFENNTIEVVQTSQYLPEYGTFKKGTKNETSNRLISVPESIMNMLADYKADQEKTKMEMAGFWFDSNRIFTQNNGTPMYPGTISRWFPKFLEKNSLPRITMHQLRHTSASLLIEYGANIKAVSERLGHANANTTMGIYAHSMRKSDFETSKKIESALKLAIQAEEKVPPEN